MSAPVKERKFIEQVHSGCGGSICVVACEREVWFACKGCRQMWHGTIPGYAGESWEDCKDVTFHLPAEQPK